MKKDNKGFSLIEIIVVICVLGIMSTLLIGRVRNNDSHLVEKCTQTIDSAMKQARTESLAKTTVCGFCLYIQNDVWYISTYGEEVGVGGSISYQIVDTYSLGDNRTGLTVQATRADGTGAISFSNNTGAITSCMRVKYATSSGAINSITFDNSTTEQNDYTRLVISKGERSQWIDMTLATGRHVVN